MPAKKVAKKATASSANEKHKGPHENSKWADVFAPRAKGEKRFWLVKSEPEVFSFDDLLASPDKTTYWHGVRNSAARNFLRDGMKKGDRVFFYHSMTDPAAVVGIGEVVREGYPDHTAFDKKSEYYDEKSKQESPTWYMVDVRAVKKLKNQVSLQQIKAKPELANMALVRISRLSVTPVSQEEWDTIVAMSA